MEFSELGILSLLDEISGSVLEKDFGPPPPPLKSVQNSKYVQNSIDRLGYVAGAIGAAGPNIRQTCKCLRYYIWLCPRERFTDPPHTDPPPALQKCAIMILMLCFV